MNKMQEDAGDKQSSSHFITGVFYWSCPHETRSSNGGIGRHDVTAADLVLTILRTSYEEACRMSHIRSVTAPCINGTVKRYCSEISQIYRARFLALTSSL